MGTIRLLLAISVTVMHIDGELGTWFLVEASMAVKLFYIISGFYMAMVLAEKYTGPGSVPLFLGNRLLRLLPVYYLLLLLPALAGFASWLLRGHVLFFGGLSHWAAHLHHLPPVASLLLGLSNLTVVGQEFSWAGAVDAASGDWVWTDDYYRAGLVPGFEFLTIPPSWTLGIELEFYCLAPFLALLRTPVLLALCGGSLASRFILTACFPVLAGLWQNHFLPCELIYFLTGMLSYRFFAAQRASGRLPLLTARGKAVLPALVGLFAGYPFLPAGPRGLVSAAALGLALPFVFALTAKVKADRALGELSYPLYLLHWNLAHVWSLLVREGWIPRFRQEWIADLLFVLVGLSLAAVLVVVVEVPVNRLRERRRLTRLVPAPG